MWNRIGDIRRGDLFGATEDLLTKLYLSFEKLVLSSKHFTKSDSDKCLGSIEQHIEFLYFIQGDLSKNNFYYKAKFMIYRIRDVISVATIPNYKGTLQSLDRDVLKGVGVTNLYENLKDIKGPPSLEIIANLRVSIVDNLGSHITSTQLDKILYLVDNFKASILSYHGGIDLLSIYKDGYRKALISDLINSKFTPILQQCYSINSLSDLLFGDGNDLNDKFFYSNSKEIYGRPYLYILRHITLRVSTWYFVLRIVE